jgi:hypothetical protein
MTPEPRSSSEDQGSGVFFLEEPMTREEVYKKQLMDLGIYDPAFDPEIKNLAILERRKTRAEKEWSATAPPGGKPSFLDPHYQIISQLEDKILQHRNALGLTPMALRKLKGAYYETQRGEVLAGDAKPENVTVLDLVREKFAL